MLYNDDATQKVLICNIPYVKKQTRNNFTSTLGTVFAQITLYGLNSQPLIITRSVFLWPSPWKMGKKSRPQGHNDTILSRTYKEN